MRVGKALSVFRRVRSRQRAPHDPLLKNPYVKFVHPKTLRALEAEGNTRGRLFSDGMWVLTHASELREKYGERWIAVINGSVIVAALTAEDAWEAAAKIADGRIPYVKHLANPLAGTRG